MPPTIGQIRSRIRARLNEATARFYQDSAVSGLLEWYSDGAAEQHRTVIEMARQAGRLSNMQHPYLRYFSKLRVFNITENQRTYPLPSDFIEKIGGSTVWVATSTTGFDEEKHAMWMDPDEDWLTRRLPQMAASYDRPTFSFKIDPDTGIVALEVFVFGNRNAPSGPLTGRLYYIRDFVPVVDLSLSSTVDLPDPYNKGPIFYAAAQAILQRGGDAGEYLELADKAAQGIFGPLVASEATAGAVQAKGIADQARSAEHRDGV